MAARTNVQSMELATLSMSATLPVTYDSAGYGATTITWTLVGSVESYGDHGLVAQTNTFTPVDTGVTWKTKGTKDYGKKSFTFGYVPVDVGQVILAAAVESKAHYSVKIGYPIGDTEATGEIHYLDVLVSSMQYKDGAANDIRKLTADFEVCRKPVVIAAT